MQRNNSRGFRGSRGRRGRGRFGSAAGRGGSHRGLSSAGRQQQQTKLSQGVGTRLSEADVGITEYISKHDGFSAVIKHRYVDFQVNEIDLDGNVVKLTSLGVPKEDEDDAVVERNELIPEDIWTKLTSMVKEVAEREETNSSKDAQSLELDVTSLDKDGRRAIHNCVKKAFKKVISNTEEKDGKKYIVFKTGKGLKDKIRGKWPEGRNGEYLCFVVHKRNIDTMETVNLISRQLGMKPDCVTFAGTKDRRAITSQLMCIWRGNPNRLFHLSKGLRNVQLGNYSYKKDKLRLGDLRGNQFRIALRHISGSDDQINAGLESLKSNGFINYYGLQRFGTNSAVPTHRLGKTLLLNEWEKAVDLILEPRDGSPDLNDALEEWKKTKDAQAALQKLKVRTNSLEELLLKRIAKHGKDDLVGALSTIPLNTSQMYLHSYQSLVWNKTVSYRIKEFGMKPIVGDLVSIRREKEPCLEDSSVITDDNFAQVSCDDIIEETKKKQNVQLLTEEDIDKFSIDDVVLPLPGFDILYPKNVVGDFMKCLLEEDGLKSELFQKQIKRYSVSGCYRHIISKVSNLSWNIVYHTDPDCDLIATDFDELRGKKMPGDTSGGKHKALLLTMSLDPSTYATMAIREITKTDTSAAIQATLSSAAAISHEELQSSVSRQSDETNFSQSCVQPSSAIKEGVDEIETDKEVEGTVPGNILNHTEHETSNETVDAQDMGVSDMKRKAEEISDVAAIAKKMKGDNCA